MVQGYRSDTHYYCRIVISSAPRPKAAADAHQSLKIAPFGRDDRKKQSFAGQFIAAGTSCFLQALAGKGFRWPSIGRKTKNPAGHGEPGGVDLI
jgi:hypothetical protein